MQLSFRLRLMIGYAVMVALPLAVFGFVNFKAVSDDLNSNLDSSLQRVAESLDYIIKQKQRETQQPLRPAALARSSQRNITAKTDYFAFLREETRRKFVGPMLPPKDTLQEQAEKANVVWAAVYEHILLNPKNYFIQVADPTNTVVWRSENLLSRTLPLPSAGMLPNDSVPFRYTIPRFTLGKQTLRIFVYHTGNAQISIGYPVDEIDSTLAELFSILTHTIPFVLIAALVAGWLLARYFVKPLADLTQTAREITAHNLSQRLPVRRVNDEITRLTETLNAMIARLEDSFRQIRQFTGDASHELRTPLAVLMGELEIALRQPHTAEEYQDVIASALEEVNRLSQVVHNLLELSRVDSGQVDIVREPVNLSLMLEDLYEDAIILAEDRNIRVEYLADDEPVIVLGDKVRLHEALLNVVENAIKYNHDGGRITLTLEREYTEDSSAEQPSRALVTVNDTGIGIPADDMPYIFDRFYRVDKSRSNSAGGHGLGLAIVKWIVEAHQGSIHVQSHVGKGTTFFLRFPL
jgi:heavy metal sensor kinase